MTLLLLSIGQAAATPRSVSSRPPRPPPAAPSSLHGFLRGLRKMREYPFTHSSFEEGTHPTAGVPVTLWVAVGTARRGQVTPREEPGIASCPPQSVRSSSLTLVATPVLCSPFISCCGEESGVGPSRGLNGYARWDGLIKPLLPLSRLKFENCFFSVIPRNFR